MLGFAFEEVVEKTKENYKELEELKKKCSYKRVTHTLLALNKKVFYTDISLISAISLKVL